jgi:succinate-semialdehyde dehydrogenase / glutarate-semialdehyde dehydrogenase
MYSDVSLFIDGVWRKAAAGRTLPVVNPATGEPISTVAQPSIPTRTETWFARPGSWVS